MTDGSHAAEDSHARARRDPVLDDGLDLAVIPHRLLTAAQLTVLGDLFDTEYAETHGQWNPDRPYGYSAADVHATISSGATVIAHVGFQRRLIGVGEHDVMVAGTGGVLVHPEWRRFGLGRRVMALAQRAMRDDAAVDFGYLGCREAVVAFYQGCGWRRIHARERHVSIRDASETMTSDGHPILVYAAGGSVWPSGEIDLRGTPW